MDIIDDIAILRRLIDDEPWARAIVDQARQDVEYWFTGFDDSPQRVSGWGHNYLCSKCNSRLIFDLATPREHVCSHCGHVNTEEKHQAVWVASYRQRLSSALVQAALLYRLDGEQRYLDLIIRAIGFYADHYHEFEAHGEWIAKGRIMWQSLEEATFSISLVKALQIVRASLDPSFLAKAHSGLFRPLALFITAEPERLLNIRLWIRSAAGVTALFFADKELLGITLSEQDGIPSILATAVTPDNLWIEGSLHYHFYALQGLTDFSLFASIYGRDGELARVTQSIRDMYTAPLHLAWSDLSFPNPNDGWPDIGVRQYIHQYELAQRLFPSPAFAWVLDRILEDEGLRNISTLLYWRPGTAESESIRERSLHFPAMNFVKLVNSDMSVFCKYGFGTRAHAHFDRMNIEIKDFAQDPSNIGYGSPLHGGWYMTTLAHNTVVVDGTNQAAFHPGQCLFFDAEGRFHGRADDAYPGVRFERELVLRGPILDDTFTCTSGEEHVYDWVFHSRGHLRWPDLPDTAWRETDLGFTTAGYDLLSDVCVLEDPATEVECCWRRGTRQLVARLEVSGGQVYRFTGHDNPPTDRRAGVLLRTRATRVEFRIHFEIRGD